MFAQTSGNTWTWTELAGYFAAAEDLFGDYDPDAILDHLRELIAEETRSNFEGKHDPAGNPWAPPKRNYGHPLMVRSGDLLDAAVQAAWSAVKTRDGLRFDLSGLPPYAVFHEFGTQKMPARPFFGISMEVTHRAEELIAADVARWMQAG